MYAYERIEEEKKKQKEIEQLQSSFITNEYDVTHQSKYISLMSSMSHTYGKMDYGFISKRYV